MIQNHIKQKIFEKSISLEKFGLCDLAWEKEDAKSLITLLMPDSIGILGGDIYIIDSTHFIPTYDNWSCEPENGEVKKDYFLRSKIVALDYINHYPFKEKMLISMVFTEIIN